MIDPERLYTPKEVGQILSVSVRTLEQWRADGRGPQYTYIERQVRYPGEPLQRYVNGWRAVRGDHDTLDMFHKK